MDLMLSLRRAVALWPDKEAVVQGSEVRLSYRQWGERVASLARGLDRRGIGRGDAIAAIAPNVFQYLEIYYAAAALGAVLAPVNTRLSPGEVATILDHSGAKLLCLHRDFSELASGALERTATRALTRAIWLEGPSRDLAVASEGYDEVLAGEPGELPRRPPLPAETLAQLYYTSGTTGAPKGVMLTHGNVATHALAAIAELGLSDADTWLHAAPLFHLADAWATFAVTWAGGRHVCLPYFEAGQALRSLEGQGITISNLIPTMLNLMVNHPEASERDLSSLRAVLSGGAPIAPETVRRIVERFGCDYVQTYGMTETSPYLTLSRLKHDQRDLPRERRLELKSRTGRPFLAVELRVVRPDGTEVARDDQEVGEIVVRGPTVTPGYWKDPEATAAAFDDRGWFHTGDLAVIDAGGSVNIVDRKKDVIISGGENIYSTEVEFVLFEHPAVLEAAVIGVPDPLWGEAVRAVVVLRPGQRATERDLIDFVKARLARFKAPKAVDFVEALPKTGSGKVSKKALRELCRPR